MNLSPPASGISRFGQTAEGGHVERIVLRGGGLTAAVLTRGVTLQGLWLDGVEHGLTIGLGSISEYETSSAYPGALVGPVANRIAGAQAVVDGRMCRFAANEGGNTLHSGPTGLHARIWRLSEMHENAVSLTLGLADGEGGFPGNRQITARYSLPGEPGCLRLELSVLTDAPSPVSLAQHSYWNLDGGANWTGHRLQMIADHWLPVDGAGIPTGERRPVADAMDFRKAKGFLPGAPALDVSYCLSDTRRPLTHAATLTGAQGISMQLYTTEPGLQVYDGRGPILQGRPTYEGIALEPQGWPDALNRPDFPQVTVRPGDAWRQVTEWHFAR